jgi:hypothetical protein
MVWFSFINLGRICSTIARGQDLALCFHLESVLGTHTWGIDYDPYNMRAVNQNTEKTKNYTFFFYLQFAVVTGTRNVTNKTKIIHLWHGHPIYATIHQGKCNAQCPNQVLAMKLKYNQD